MQSRPGTYVHILECRDHALVEVGRWGRLAIAPGYYVYVGSAFGPGGVRARVLRHCRKDKAKHWHIDYLRDYMAPVIVWISYDAVRLEHRWAKSLAGMSGMQPINGFGCTDCTCPCHLFHSGTEPDFDRFSASVEGNVALWVCRDSIDGKPVLTQ